MASARTLAVLDSAAWVLIFGGAILLVLALATGNASVVAGWSFGVLGGAAFIAGVVLIVVRARLTPPGGAQSSDTKRRGTP